MTEEPKARDGDHEPKYDQAFYDNFKGESLLSAREVVPLVVNFIKPQSVVDVGCGMGVWLSVFGENRVADLMGVDGDYVDKSSLLIPEDKFFPHDLRKPLRLNREFDLVVSLEVAEHLSEKYADEFIESLTLLGPIVMFSAAIPYQGGTHHVNEQWQDYWRELFEKRDFCAVDYVRPRIWDRENVGVWYAQNLVLYVRRAYLESHDDIRRECEKTTLPLSRVHPTHYVNRVLLNNLGLKRTLMAMPGLIWKAVLRKLSGR